MKKNIFALCISLSSLLSPLSSLKTVADEGMWTLYNLPSQVYAQMQQEGFSLPSTALYSDANAISVSYDSSATGIDYVGTSTADDTATYDLQGRRVVNSQMRKGIYVKKGSVIVK